MESYQSSSISPECRSHLGIGLVIDATRDGAPEYVAGVASVRNTHEVEQLVESGHLYWHSLEDRTPAPE